MSVNLKKYRVPKTAITERGLKKLIAAAVKEGGHASYSEWANSNEITPQVISAFMRNTQTSGLQIPKALGYKPQTIFIPVDEPDITVPRPPRRPAEKPMSKVDHSRDPVEKKNVKKKDERKEAKKRLKKRNK